MLRKANGELYNAARDDLTESRNCDLVKRMRQQMMQGQWPAECVRCRTEEESGLNSRRVNEHKRWTLRKADVAAHTASDGAIDTAALPVTYYDLRFGNLCNLACRMCGPQDSTGWYDDYHRMENVSSFEDTHGLEHMYRVNGKWVSDSYGWHGSDTFWAQIEANANNIQHVYMAGGEPLLIARHYEFLERCIANGAAKNMLVEYNTNLTTVSSRLLNLWQAFRKIQIGASIDGYGAVFEYQRYPARWDKVLHNIGKVDCSSDNITAWFAYTVTAYNVLHLPDFMRWKLEHSGLRKFNDDAIRPIVNYHVAHRPKELNIRVLPPQIKQLVTDKLDHFNDWVLTSNYPSTVVAQGMKIRNGIVNYMNSHDTHGLHWDAFKTYTSSLDRIRGQNLVDVVPELAAYL